MNLKSQNHRSYIWLVVGSILMFFSNWSWAIPAASWSYSVFLLRYARTRKALSSLFVLCFASMAVGVVSMCKLLDMDAIPLWFRVVSGLAVGVAFALPFMIDRLLVGKINGVVSTLVFPCAWTACEYVKSLGGGSWGAIAYTQYGNLHFMQLASITGIWGLSFLVAWFASLVNHVWEQEFRWRRSWKIAVAYCLVVGSVFLYGSIRLASPTIPTKTVCVASITNPRDFDLRFYRPDWTDRKAAHERMNRDLGYFMDASARSVRDGARIVLWQEYSVAVTEEHEQEFIDRASRLAKENNIYLAMAVAVFPLSYPDRPWRNKLVWVGPDGKIIAEYLKSKPAPPLEPIAPGGDAIPILDTPYGKIASVICADLDYPGLLHQDRVHEADILLIPAQDWAAVDPLHTNMSVFRAIENGVSMVKGTGGGLSIAVDPYGRVINAADYFDSGDAPMIACLPVGGVRTIYSMIGDGFAWLCILGIVAMSIWGYAVKKRRAQSV